MRGRLVEEGWGADHGYPGLILDPAGGAVDVHVFESPDLPAYWARLDQFEGEGYRRVVTQIHTEAGEIDACIYVIAAPP